MSININTNLIRQIRQLKRGKNTLLIIDKELRRLGIYRSELTSWAYYLMSFKYWEKDFVMVYILEEMKHLKNVETNDIDLQIIFSILKGDVKVK